MKQIYNTFLWLLKIKICVQNPFQGLFLNNFIILRLKIVTMYEFDTDIDTNDSSIQILSNPQIAQQILEGVYKLTEFQQSLKRIGFKKMMEIFLTNHYEKSEQYLNLAQMFCKKRKYTKSSEYAHLAYISGKNDQTKFLRSLIILIEIKINLFKLTEAQKLIQQISSIKNIVFWKQILIVKTNFFKLSGNLRKMFQCLDELEKQYIENQNAEFIQRSQLMVFCGQSLLAVNKYEEAHIKLHRWLPMIIRQKIQNYEIPAKIYYLMALIEKRRGNLYNEFSHLYCASATVLHKKEHQDLFLKIQCEKIRNLINRKLMKNAVSEIQYAIKILPQAMSKKYPCSSQLQQLVESIGMQLASSASEMNSKVNEYLLGKTQNLLKQRSNKYGYSTRNSIYCI